jgi:2-polyprenyl-6-methoxyphenol hydroxylase-like FAD-dependent oxidoreductase
VGVAFLWSGAKGNYELFLERFPELCRKLGVQTESQIRGAGPFDVRVESRVKGRVLLVGDAAGYLDAITGEGITLGFEAAEALVHCTLSDRPQDYEAAGKQLYRRYSQVTRLMLWVARHPWLRRRVVRALSRSPEAFQGFLALNSGAYSWTQALPSAGRVGLGLLTG